MLFKDSASKSVEVDQIYHLACPASPTAYQYKFVIFEEKNFLQLKSKQRNQNYENQFYVGLWRRILGLFCSIDR